MSQYSSDLLQLLDARGYIHQLTDAAALDALATKQVVPGYIGFDPTAPSLHVGSLVQIMLLRRLQQTGHKPIVVMGGGTGKIGDPSFKDEARRLMTADTIASNVASIKRVFERFLTFGDGPTDAIMVDNAEWLDRLEYIPFLRDIGQHFSINRMLSFDSVKLRLDREQSLSFLEFNYMIVQAYDFLELSRRVGCRLQMGGSDQWGNIVNGIELARRVDGTEVYGVTTPLITLADGGKMGKTEKGTVLLDAMLTSPYDYYQYWINTEDADLERFLALFTFLPMEEIASVAALTDARLNMAKAVLAFEATKITHGEKAALGAFRKSSQLFGIRAVEKGLLPSSTIPRDDPSRGADVALSALTLDAAGTVSSSIERGRLNQGIPAFELFHESKLCDSRGEARRLINQGGGYVNDRQLTSFDEKIGIGDADARGEIRLRKGKKKYAIVSVKN